MTIDLKQNILSYNNVYPIGNVLIVILKKDQNGDYSPYYGKATHAINLNGYEYLFNITYNNWIYFYINTYSPRPNNMIMWESFSGWQGDHFTIGIEQSRRPILKLHETKYSRNSQQPYNYITQKKECNIYIHNIIPRSYMMPIQDHIQYINNLSCINYNMNNQNHYLRDIWNLQDYVINDFKTFLWYLIYPYIDQQIITRRHRRGGKPIDLYKYKEKTPDEYIDENIPISQMDIATYFNKVLSHQKDIDEIHIMINTETKEIKTVYFLENDKIVSPIESIEPYITCIKNNITTIQQCQDNTYFTDFFRKLDIGPV